MDHILQQHFYTNINEDERKSVVQVMKKPHDAGKCKVECAQAQNGKRIGTVNQKGIAGDGHNCRDGIERKNHICRFNYNQNYKKGRCNNSFAPFNKKVGSLNSFSDW